MTIHELSQLVLEWIWARPKPLQQRPSGIRVSGSFDRVERLLVILSCEGEFGICGRVPLEDEARRGMPWCLGARWSGDRLRDDVPVPRHVPLRPGMKGLGLCTSAL
jgi:hypothetical protein